MRSDGNDPGQRSGKTLEYNRTKSFNSVQNGKIDGAEKQGKRWMIPKDAETGRSADKDWRLPEAERPAKLPLPIGVSDYCLASSEYYYIDKTMMIKDFIDERQW